MSNKTISNIIFTIAVNVLVKPFWLFGIDRVVQNRLGEEVFGIYFTLFNFSMIYQIVLDFGLQQLNSKEIAEDKNRLHQYFFNFLVGKFLLALVFIALAIPTFIFLGYDWSTLRPMICLLLLNQVLISIIYYLRSNIAGLQKFKIDALFSVLDKIIMIGLGIYLLYGETAIELNIINFIAIQTIAFSISFILQLGYVGSLASPFRTNFHFEFLRDLVRRSWPFALSIFLMSIYLRMDALMIERLLPLDGRYQAGIYAQSFRILDALNMIGIYFASVLLPTYAKAFAERHKVIGLVKKALALLWFIILPVAIALVVFRVRIIDLLYNDSSLFSANILGVLMVSFIAYNTMHIFSSMLTAANQLKFMNKLFFVGVIINFASNLVLIPNYGALGAAITTSCSQVLIVGVLIVYALRYLKQN